MLSYQNPELPIGDRVSDLLGRMTIEEKLAQMSGVWNPFDCDTPDAEYDASARQRIPHGIGHLARPREHAEPAFQARSANRIQRWLRDHTRLGIPAIIHVEALAGLVFRGATQFPQAINWASTWNPDLLRASAEAIGDQMRLLGMQQALSPLMDINRDVRSGRIEETYGEDPLLVAAMSSAFVRGLQEKDGRLRLIATAKHFAGYGFTEGGRNAGSVRIGEREFRDEFLFPFEAAVKTAGVESIMNGYHEIDGVPCSINRWLLTDVLRGEWGFPGTVVSDYGSIPHLFMPLHSVAADAAEASALAVNAGMDLENLEREAFHGLPEAIERGLIDMAAIDLAVGRTLRHKFLLGLFENPFVDEALATVEALDPPLMRAMAFEAAAQSIVLEKNDDGILPLTARRILVTGPNADLSKALLGDYCYGIHQDLPGTSIDTVAAGLRRRCVQDGTVFEHVVGCGHDEFDSGTMPAVLAAAQRADVVVAVMGEVSHVHSGEVADRANNQLPGEQERFIAELAAAGRPVVLVLVNGRPLSTAPIAKHCTAIVEAWYPGEEGANAIAAVLFGDREPCGRLPASVPECAAHAPLHYNRRRTAMAGCYQGRNVKPYLPFGHGLTYTRFAYSRLVIPDAVVAGEPVSVSFDLENIGKRHGTEVAQLYLRDEVGSVSRPLKELRGFARVLLQPGEKRRIEVTVPADLLAFHGLDKRLAVEPGAMTFLVGASSEDIRLEGVVTLTGTRRILAERRTFFPDVHVSAPIRAAATAWA